MEFVAQVLAFEGRRDLLLEVTVGVEPADLVLVFVGHEREQRAHRGLRERGRVRDRARLGLAHALDR